MGYYPNSTAEDGDWPKRVRTTGLGARDDRPRWWAMQVVSVRRQVVVVCAVSVVSVWLLLQLDITQTHRLLAPPPHWMGHEEPAKSGFLVDTRGCRIPEQDPLDPSVRQFVYREKEVVCDPQGRRPLLTASGPTSVCLQLDLLHEYGVPNVSLIDCCYRPFWRVVAPDAPQYTKAVDTSYKYSNTCWRFIDHCASPPEDFVRVECYHNGSQIYTDFFALFHPNRSTEGSSGGVGVDQKMSVLVVGVDAVSRLNFYRQMPETAAFLKELGAFEMLGYNKVEDNTFPNLVPVLTGLTEAELKATCWPSTSSVFDDCPFLWKRYSEAGFLTAYGEDASWMGTFNYMKNGFHKQPTDFYLQIFNHVAEKEAGHEKRLNANLCVGKRLNLDMLLGGVASFALGSLGAPFFGFFWGGSLSHDFLNLPRLGDKSHLKMLQLFKDQGLLERTVFVLMSDHGIRWGGIRETYQGYLEERLPFLFLVLPQWFREEFPTAVSYLRLNGRRLTTPFDLHETLKDLVDLKGLRKNEIKKRMQSDTPGGRSLFLPISDERNCTSARIADNWCTCHQSEPLSANSSGAVQAARALVGRLNALLDGHRECARLDVGSVISARLEVPTSHLSAPKETIPVKDYTVTVRTRPGGGLFEATVRRDPGGYKVVGTVSRINTYGDQSACIAHYKLKLYCFCLPR